MTREVLVSITGLHETENDTDSVQTICEGQYRYVNKKHIVCYKEPGELPGEETTCLLKISPQQVTLTKKTTPATEMVFCPDSLSHTSYQTPMGSISLALMTSGLEVSVSPTEIRVQLAYRLFWGDAPANSCRLTVVISPRTEKCQQTY
jgi:uncharacterized beta-barrel protein YwiB (DUF1934 family)